MPIDPAHLDVVRDGMQMNLTWHRDNLVKGLVAPEFDPQGNPVPGAEQFRLPAGVTAGVKTGTAEYGTEVDDRGLAAASQCLVYRVRTVRQSRNLRGRFCSGRLRQFHHRRADRQRHDQCLVRPQGQRQGVK